MPRSFTVVGLLTVWFLIALGTWTSADITLLWVLGDYRWWVLLTVWCLALAGTLAVTWFAWRRAAAVAVAAALVGLLAWALPPVSPRMLIVDAQDWFVDQRKDFEEAARSNDLDCCTSYLGRSLEKDLAHLSVNGRVVGNLKGLFFPQWFALVDDAGGYWYVPDGSPEGFNMYGYLCSSPVDLGDDWWMCGM